MVFASILGFAVVMVLWYFIGKEFARIAAMKGHTDSRYFWWTFLVGPVGIGMVIALPNNGKAASMSADELPEI